MIHVIAAIALRAGQRAAFLKAFKELLPEVRAEPGCLEYSPAIDAVTNVSMQLQAGDDTVIVVEKWASVTALVEHLQAPHVTAFLARHQNLIARVSLQVLEPA